MSGLVEYSINTNLSFNKATSNLLLLFLISVLFFVFAQYMSVVFAYNASQNNTDIQNLTTQELINYFTENNTEPVHETISNLSLNNSNNILNISIKKPKNESDILTHISHVVSEFFSHILNIRALLTYENQTAISNQMLSLISENIEIGNITNSSGWAEFNFNTSGLTVGNYLINITYTGNLSANLFPSYNDTIFFELTEPVTKNKTNVIENTTNITEIPEENETENATGTHCKQSELSSQDEIEIIELEDIQYEAEIEKPVKWIKRIRLNNVTNNLTINIPESAFGVSVRSIALKSLEYIPKGIRIEMLSSADQIELEYYTDPPQIDEIDISPYKKQIIVHSDIHYQDITAHTDIEYETEKENIKLYHIADGSKQPVENIKYIDKNGNSLIDRIEWIVPFLSNQTYEVEITILNVQSYPVVGGNWTVRFDTFGKANLTIRPIEGTSWDDLEFLKLKCGNNIITTELTNGMVFVNDYECNETGYEVSRILTPGKHILEFDFGGVKTYARNQASASTNVQAESGRVLLTATQTTITLRNTYNISRAFISTRFSGDTTANGVPNWGTVMTTWIGSPLSNQINVTRYNAGTDTWFSYSIIQADNIQVWNFTASWTTASTQATVTLSPALPSSYGTKCFAEVHRNTKIAATNTDCNSASNVRANISSSTTVELTRELASDCLSGDNPSGETSGFVVCFLDNSNVTNFELYHSGAQTDSYTLDHDANISNSYVVFSFKNNNDGVSQNTLRVNFTAANEVTSDRGYGSAGTLNASVYVIEFENGTGGLVQHNNAFDLAGSTINYQFSLGTTVNENKTLIECSSDIQYGTGANHYKEWWTYNLTDNGSKITANKTWAGSSSQLTDISCQAITWPNATSYGNPTLEAESSLGEILIPPSTTTTLTGNCTESFGFSAGDVYIIVQDNSSGNWANTPTSDTDIYTNTTYYYIGSLEGETSNNYDFQITGAGEGAYGLRIQCNSSNADEANSTGHNLTVTYSPAWSNLDANNSNPSVGDSVKFYAYWQDSDGLNTWIFSWNGTLTEEWENETIQQFTGTGNWSNRTIVIPSHLSGKQVGYRFYANDSLGAMNETDIKTIDIQLEDDFVPPSINWFNATPNVTGYGYNITIQTNITDNVGVDPDTVQANITYPNGTSFILNMSWVSGDIFEVNFTDTWQWGNYSYYVTASDTSANPNETMKDYPKNFSIKANATISMQTVQSSYGANDNVTLDWSYRMPINITENSATSLTDYAVNLTIDTKSLIAAGKMNSDCSDIRFRDNDSSTELGFWIEKDCNESNTSIYVKLNLSASEERTIYMYYGNPAASSASSFANAWRLIGEANVTQINTTWHDINLTNSYETPVVVHGPADFAANQDEEVVGRVQGVTQSSFQFKLQEPNEAGCRDDSHPYENISYIVIENGTWVLPGGKRIEAGNYSTSATSGKAVTDSWDTITYRITDFPSAPAVISQTMAYDDSDYAKTRHQSIGTTTFQVSFNEDETQSDVHGPEMLGWVAVETGTGSINGIGFQAGTTANVDRYADYCASPYECTWTKQTFSITVTNPPVLVASTQTVSGGDNSYLRYNNPTTSSVDFGVEEEICDTTEKDGNPEVVGWLVFGEPLNIYGRQWVTSTPTMENLTEETLSNTLNDTGSTNISGYLLMQILDNETLNVVSTQVNDTETGTKRTINVSEPLSLASIWNLNPWNTTNSAAGYYRVYAALTDPYGNILTNDTGDSITGYYVFFLDTVPPQYNNLGSNTSNPDPLDWVKFYCNWSDSSGLDSWTFEWNVSGNFATADSGTFSSNPDWSNTTLQIPSSAELKTIAYRFTATDDDGNPNTTETKYINIGDITEPDITNETVDPTFLNRYGYANITANVSDNNATHTVWAYIGIPQDSYTNETLDPMGDDVYNLSYQCNSIGQYNVTIYANDSSGNENNSLTLTWDVYGWSNITWHSPDDGSYSKGTPINLTCIVMDKDNGTAINNYPVTFWNDTTQLGTNYTNSTGYAVFQWNTTGLSDGDHVLNCTITHNATLYYNASSVNNGSTTITLLAPDINVTNLDHENDYTYSITEYETGDQIAWVNVTVNNTGGSPAYNVNVSLNILDPDNQIASWFEEQSQDCGSLSVNQECQSNFTQDNISTTATPGTYTFNITINWSGGGSPPNYNATETFIIHHIPNNLSSALSPIKILQNQSSTYNITITNPWSANITNVNISLYPVPNITFNCTLSGQQSQQYCYLENITSTNNKTASFNITTDSNTTPGEYSINATVNYTNPGSEQKSWEQQQSQTLNVRGPTKLNVSISAYTSVITRDSIVQLNGSVNNTGDSTTNNIWLNWTLPSGWTNQSGNLNLSNSTLAPHASLWNNITANVSISADLGSQQIQLISESDEEASDWDTKIVTIYADTSVPYVYVNNTNPYRNESIYLEARVVYDNSSGVQGETLTFRLNGNTLGTNTTNSTGYATLTTTIPYDTSTGPNTINITYSGSAAIYTNPGYNDTESVTVQDEIRVENQSASPQIQGYGQNVTISADVWSRVEIDFVRANITYPNQSTTLINLTYSGSGNTYSVNFQDTWQKNNYSYFINASNTANYTNDTTSQYNEFNVSANATVVITTEIDVYPRNQNISVDTQNWWNKSFLYRKRINIKENSDSSLTEYQVNITLNTSYLVQNGKMQSDCNDTRFILYNETTDTYTKLSYWFDPDECNTANTIFWIKLSNIPASSNVTVYIYYGDSSAQDESNISSTFVFGDDFNRPDNSTPGNGWTDDYGYGSIENNQLKIASSTSAGTFREQIHHSFPSPDMDYVMEYKGNTSQTDKSVYSNYFGEQVNRRYSMLFHSSGMIRYLNNSIIYDTSKSYPSGTWYNFRIWYKRSTEKVNYYVNSDLEATDAEPSTGSLTDEVAFGGETDSTAYWDDVRVRKKASSEPTVTFFEEENLHSIIKNTGTVNISGYVLMVIQNQTTGEAISVRINDSGTGEKRTITTNGVLNLSGIWDTNPWYTDDENNGYYRLYVAFTDPYGNVLKNDSDENISAYYDFYADTEPPQWSNFGINDSYPKPDLSVKFYSYWTDDYNLSNWIFSWNCTASGSWNNISSGNFSNTGNWSNTTQIIPAFANNTYGYRFYAWDDAGNLNSTDIYTFEISGNMEVELIEPVTKSVAHNFTFTANATVICRNGTCGNVSGRIRYNASASDPDTDINTSEDVPFYIMDNPNPQNCSDNPLIRDEWCNLTWTVNATGDIGSSYKVGVLFESSISNVESNNTQNSTINIVSCVIEITTWDNVTFQEPLYPGERKNATGNDDKDYNITVGSATTCKVDLYVSGEDLQCYDSTCSGYSIGVGNVTWSNVSNDYATSYNLTSAWAEVNTSVDPGVNTTTYYWINVPDGIAYGRYNATLTVQGVEEGSEP